MTRGYADASIGGLCSAAATILSLSVAFWQSGLSREIQTLHGNGMTISWYL